MESESKVARLKLFGALGIVYVVWGSTYLAIKVGIETLPPMFMAGVRFLLAGVLLYAWTARTRSGERPVTPTRTHWRTAAVTGLLMLLGGNGAVTWAEQQIDSGMAALLVASVPLWMALIAWWQDSRRPTGTVVLGLAVGFAGVAALVRPSGEGTNLAAAVVVLLGSLSWAIGSMYVRRARLHPDPLRATAMQMISAAGGFAVAGLIMGEPAQTDLGAASFASVAAMLYLAVFGSLVAFTAYTWLLRNTAPATVSTYAYVNPVVAVALGVLVLGEPLTPAILVSGGLIVAGVALIVGGDRGGVRAARAKEGSEERLQGEEHSRAAVSNA